MQAGVALTSRPCGVAVGRLAWWRSELRWSEQEMELTVAMKNKAGRYGPALAGMWADFSRIRLF
jgi:hypothetical protein